MSKIWWKNKENSEIQVFNHIEGVIEKSKAAKHMENGDLFIFNNGYYGSPTESSAILVPPKLMKKILTAEENGQLNF